MSCALQTCAISVAHCRHVRFPASKRTGCRASSHIITSYVLKRNRKQANPKESRALFWVWAGRAGWKTTFFLKCISEKTFLQIRINSPVGNHPSQTFLANQDQSPRRKSSLTDFSSKSGCIFSLEIIPPRHFLLIRMHFSVGNHPSQIFPANQDAFPRWKSSLADIFSKSGSISPLEIIPHRLFQQIKMHFLVGNHPSQIFLANQDQSPRWKSSFTGFSSKSGSISPLEIIPRRHFLLIRMNPIERNHLWTSILANQDQFPPLKKRPPKKRPSKSLSSLRDRQSTLDKGYNSFREKFNGIRTPTKK